MPSRVALAPGGLRIQDECVPLHAGTVHYFRLDPNDWRACLAATRKMGVRLVDVYVPWAVHEEGPGKFDFGTTDPKRDVARFLRLAQEEGLFAIVRPGPHINAEMTNFGIPERVIWDTACQARSPRNKPVVLPMFPVCFPVPSYTSEAFFDEVSRYFSALGPVLRPLVYPDGPIVLLQIDNEGAYYFRDGLYDQDYHPDALAQYRQFLRDKYKTPDALPAAYAKLGRAGQDNTAPKPRESKSTPPAPVPEPHREPAIVTDPAGARPPSSPPARAPSSPPPPEPTVAEIRFADLLPPARFDGTTHLDLAPHLDWAEAQEHFLVNAFRRFGEALSHAGLTGIPTVHNFPPGDDATPLSAHAVSQAVDLIGVDFYYPATPDARAIVARRTGELAAFSGARGRPAFSSEMGAGFPPFFPPLDERDSAFTLMTALAYGLRGANLYMAVERDRWIGAPIDRRGRPRPFAAFYEKLFRALTEVSFHTLVRRTPVRIVIPRHERRLMRVLHAFGPVSGVGFSVFNLGARERCLEDDLGLSYPVGTVVHTFVRALEESLDARGVPFAIVESFEGEAPIDGASWILCATSGGLDPRLFERLVAARAAGAHVSIGPQKPLFDALFQPLPAPFDEERLRPTGADPTDDHGIPLFLDDTPAGVDLAVSRAIDLLGLPAVASDPHGVFATLHETEAGAPKVAFLVNPMDTDVSVRTTVGKSIHRAEDPIAGETIGVRNGTLEAVVPKKTVRMFVLG